MTKPKPANDKSLNVPVSTVVRLVKLLGEENLSDEFILSAHALRVDLSPVMKFLNDKGVEAPQGETVPVSAAAAATRLVHTRFEKEFAANEASTARVRVSPRLILQTKKFLSRKGINRRNEFAASIVQADPQQCPTPGRCPHIQD
jgi:hypothetical protein